MKSKPRSDLFSIRFSLMLIIFATLLMPMMLFLSLVILHWFGFDVVDFLKDGHRFFLLILLMQGFGLAVTLGLLAKKLRSDALSWSVIGFRRFPILRSLKYIFGFYGLILGFLVTFAVIAASLGLTPPAEGSPVESAARGFWQALVVTVLLAPFIEEILFRGLLFTSFSRKYSVVVSIILSGLIFALVHLEPTRIILVLPMGIYLAVMYHRLNSIVPGIFLHASWNLLVLVVK